MTKSLPPLHEIQEWLRYDPKTGKFFWVKLSGKKMTPGKEAGWNSNGYIIVTVRDRRVPAHRLAWLFAYGKDPGHSNIDHINLDRSDNRICNLRLATQQQNMCNLRKRLGTTSTYKGVSWYKRHCKWQAQIRVDGQNIYLGCYDNELDAHLAYCAAATRLHGEFANFG